MACIAARCYIVDWISDAFTELHSVVTMKQTSLSQWLHGSWSVWQTMNEALTWIISDFSIWSLKLHAIAIPCCIHGLNLLLPLPALMPFDYGNPVAVKGYLGCLHFIDLFLKELCLKLPQTMNGGTDCEMSWAFHGHVGVRCWWEACAVCSAFIMKNKSGLLQIISVK